MNNNLNLWDNAEYICTVLKNPLSKLIIIIGASEWCNKCAIVEREFHSISKNFPKETIALWLDVEDHSSFTNNYSPENLPEIFIYKNKKLVHRDYLNNNLIWHVSDENNNHPTRDYFSDAIYNNITKENWSIS